MSFFFTVRLRQSKNNTLQKKPFPISGNLNFVFKKKIYLEIKMFTSQNNAFQTSVNLQKTFIIFVMLYNYTLFSFHPFERPKPSVYYSDMIKRNAI